MSVMNLPTAPYRRVGNTIYLSGHIGDSGGQLSADFVEQTQQTFDNMAATLAEEGASLSDVVSVTCYISDFARFEDFNEIWKKNFAQSPPTRATVKVEMASEEILIELQAIAHLSE